MGVIKLNKQQQKAVDQIYGPLLVLAGPGTGKTQLLSARIANVLEKTDANPQNILCLTFTENAAQNMRDRLNSIIGSDAYDVHIATYHGFGSDIIRSYPEYFEEIDLETGKDTRVEKPIDSLQQIQIIDEIVDKLPYDSPLIGAKHYLKYVVGSISELKRSLLSPKELEQIAKDNLKEFRSMSPKIADQLQGIKRFPSTADKSIEIFTNLLGLFDRKNSLSAFAVDELEEVLTEATEISKSKPLTAWKNKWLRKNEDNEYTFTEEYQHLRIIELSKIYSKYQQALEERQVYDFDDMILRTITALQKNKELKYNLQEKYQFILLDEFQDTNTAQFELFNQLADNPVNEGQPNIFAVGDDDQAIYSFQGAKSSNMLKFVNTYRDVTVINLTENYRSHPDIIHSAHNVAKQIESRMHTHLENVEKTLVSSANNLPKDSTIERHEFLGLANELAWVSSRIKEIIAKGTSPREITILAPKHKILEQILPYLIQDNIPITYEKREDILQTKLTRSLRLMSELVVAVQSEDLYLINYLLPRVLSLDFYEIPAKDIWTINWQHKSRDEDRSWAEIALENKTLAPHVMFYLTLGLKSHDEPMEYILDYLMGSLEAKLDKETDYISPFKEYYFSKNQNKDTSYYEMLANLSSIREHLRAYQAGEDNLFSIEGFLEFCKAYETAGQPLINTHPISQATDSVQLMTVYKAKGLEFEHVFLLSVHDDVWGSKARSSSNKIALPANLQYIRYQGSDEDELKRLLFVAITRAKHGLYLTSHASKDNGKQNQPVKYIQEREIDEKRSVEIFPKDKQSVALSTFSADETMDQVMTLWEGKHLTLDAELKNLLKPRLDKYQMSPTHLNTFIDMEYGGPEVFLLQTLLRFPQAPGIDGEFGNAVHETLDWAHRQQAKEKIPTHKSILKEFDKRISKRYIPEERLDDFRRRGHDALGKYLESRPNIFKSQNKSEVDFRNEGVVLDSAHLSGKIDLLEIDMKNKTVDIVDYKTGKPHSKWERSIKLLKYKQQLYFYKILIDNSHTWKEYRVKSARLEFIEPNQNGKIEDPLYIDFNKDDQSELVNLIQKIWKKIIDLDLPDTSLFSSNYNGTIDIIDNLTKNI